MVSTNKNIPSTEELQFGVQLFKTQEMFDKLNKILKKENILLTIKIHPAQHPDTYKNFNDFSNILMITPEKERKLKLNKYNLMKNTDALISDYSGAAYEFLLLNKPLGFVIDDMATYKIGFLVDNVEDYMPGNLIKNYEDFMNFIRDIIVNNDRFRKEREELLDYIYKYRDGNSCKRLMKFLGI